MSVRSKREFPSFSTLHYITLPSQPQNTSFPWLNQLLIICPPCFLPLSLSLSSITKDSKIGRDWRLITPKEGRIFDLFGPRVIKRIPRHHYYCQCWRRGSFSNGFTCYKICLKRTRVRFFTNDSCGLAFLLNKKPSCVMQGRLPIIYSLSIFLLSLPADGASCTREIR